MYLYTYYLFSKLKTRKHIIDLSSYLVQTVTTSMVSKWVETNLCTIKLDH